MEEDTVSGAEAGSDRATDEGVALEASEVVIEEMGGSVGVTEEVSGEGRPGDPVVREAVSVPVGSSEGRAIEVPEGSPASGPVEVEIPS